MHSFLFSRTYIVKRRRRRVLWEVDCFQIDDIKVAAHAGVGAVDLALGIAELNALDVVIVDIVNQDPEERFPSECGVNAEAAFGHIVSSCLLITPSNR